MPRDLFMDADIMHEASAQDLSLHPEPRRGERGTDTAYEHEEDDDDDPGYEPGILDEVDIVGESGEMLKQLHPYAQVLGLVDVDSCLQLEEVAFEEGHRGAREKFIYRLTRCSEMCLGLFTSAGPDSPEQQATTASTANPPDSNDPKRKTVLLAHIMATKTTNEKVTEEDMEIPENWEERATEESNAGHKEHGRTILIHSFAVLPEYQQKGLGSILMKSYIQRMVEAGTADRVALLAYDHLIPFYEGMGFTNTGKSSVQFGGAEWYNMVIEFDDIRPDVVSEDDSKDE